MLRIFAAVLLLTGAAVAQTQTPQALLQHAIELHQAGDIEGAIAAYQAFLKQRPDAYQIRSNLGAAFAKAGRYDEAIEQYREALKPDPSNSGIRLNLALAHYKAGHIVEAEKIFASLHQNDPGNRQVTMLEADCQLRMGEDKQVIALLTPLQTQTPDDLALDYMLGTALIRDKQTGPGEIVINRVLKAGDSAEARLLMGTTKSNVADFAGALVDLEAAVKLNPNLPDVYSYYGMALLSTGDQVGAAAAFRKELASNPNDFIANLQLGALLRADQEYDEAETYINKALLVRQGDIGARYQQASIHLSQNKIPEAMRELEAIVKESPRFLEAHVSLATVYYRVKRKAEADRERALVQQLNAEIQAKQPGAVAR